MQVEGSGRGVIRKLLHPYILTSFAAVIPSFAIVASVNFITFSASIRSFARAVREFSWDASRLSHPHSTTPQNACHYSAHIYWPVIKTSGGEQTTVGYWLELLQGTTMISPTTSTTILRKLQYREVSITVGSRLQGNATSTVLHTVCVAHRIKNHAAIAARNNGLITLIQCTTEPDHTNLEASPDLWADCSGLSNFITDYDDTQRL